MTLKRGALASCLSSGAQVGVLFSYKKVLPLGPDHSALNTSSVFFLYNLEKVTKSMSPHL